MASDLGRRLEQIITGADTPRPAYGVREQLADLRAQHGSIRGVARALGVNESVVRRTLSGQTRTPRAGLVGAVERTFRAADARRITPADIRIPVTEVRRGQRGRQRELRAKNLGIRDQAQVDRIRQAYVQGGTEAAALQFLKETKDPVNHYRQWLTPDSLRGELEDDTEPDYSYSVG